MTEQAAIGIDEYWAKVRTKNRALKILAPHGITVADIDRKYEELFKQNSRFNLDDAIWTIFNSVVVRLTDQHQLKTLYWEMALLLWEQDREFIHVLKQAGYMELLKHKNHGVKQVKTLDAGEQSCPECQALNGRVFDIGYALEHLPIPNENCTHMAKEGKRGFCRCVYLPIINEIY